MFDFDDITVDEKLDEIEKESGIPKKKLCEVYNKLYDRVKIELKARDILIGRKKFMAYAYLRHAIKDRHPIAFCPLCAYHTHKFRQFQSHLKDEHKWGVKALDKVRRGFWAAKNKKRLSYGPKLH